MDLNARVDVNCGRTDGKPDAYIAPCDKIRNKVVMLWITSISGV